MESGTESHPTPLFDWTRVPSNVEPVDQRVPQPATPRAPAFPTQFHDPQAPRPAAPPPAGLSAGRFAPLSALPPDKRLPMRRTDAPAPPADQGQSPRPQPRSLPGNPEVKPVPYKQIGFNCPSCLAILIIKQPENYDGQAAPCPSCGVVILPPRIAPPSPFTLLAPASQRGALPPPPLAALNGQKPPTLVSQPKKPGLPGAKRLAQAAMF